MRTLRALHQAVSGTVTAAVTFLFLVMLALAVLQVGLRLFLNTSMLWADPLARRLTLWVCLLGAVLATGEGKHFQLEVLTRIAGSGFRQWLRMLSHLLSSALAGYLYSIASIGSEFIIRKDAPSNPETVMTGNVVSVFGEVKAPFAGLESRLSAIGRYDVVEPNTKKGGDMTRFLVAGLVYKV